jgi:hypothetical protein
MLLWFRHGWREESSQIVLVAMARVVSYAGGTMIGTGGAMIGAAGRMVAALAAMVWRWSSECSVWMAKGSSSSIEQEQKKLEINEKLDNL